MSFIQMAGYMLAFGVGFLCGSLAALMLVQPFLHF
jgi:hypothetical protein